jgi:hypothetical protein
MRVKTCKKERKNMSDAFLILERVGDGYFVKPTGGRGDALMFINQYTLDADAASVIDTGVAFADYAASIVGLKTGNNAVDVNNFYAIHGNGDNWDIIFDATGNIDSSSFVDVLFIHNSLCLDNR